MNKLIFFLFIFLLQFVVVRPGFSQVEIRDVSVMEYYDLRGDDGFNGRDGFHADAPDCSSGEVLNGHDGQDGRNGENGHSGANVYIYQDKIENLAKLTFDLRGGVGGTGGKGGRGSRGCNGGYPGKKGEDGLSGRSGKFGKIFLLSEDFVIPAENNTKLVYLTELYKQPTKLSENIWKVNTGAKNYFNSNSKISDEYFTYEKKIEYTVAIDWQLPGDIERFDDVKMAINIQDEKLEVKTYTGGLLVYHIERNQNNFVIAIHGVFEEFRFRNLKLKKLRGSGDNLSLEVVEKFSPNSDQVLTKFVLSVKKVSLNNMEHNEARYYEIPNTLVYKEEKSYFINIGKLKFPDKLKAKGVKLKLQLTIYRELPGQTRVQGLEGIFKI